MMMLVCVVAVTVLISFLCSLSEAVLYSLPITAVESMLQRGIRSGRFFKRFKQDIQRPISAIAAMNTIINTAGAALSAALFLELFGGRRLSVFTLALTLAILFFAEILPKTLGVFYNRGLAGFAAWTIQFMIWLLGPIVFVIRKIMEVVLPRPKGERITPQEIISLANIGHEEGAIEFLEAKIIENILWLRQKKAAAIMTPRSVVSLLNIDHTLGETECVAGGWPHSRMPAYQGTPDNIVGFVMGRDAFSLLCEGQKDVRIADLLRPVHVVRESERADLLLLTFLEKRQHLFVVKNEADVFVGVVTLEDVLEEIIGREIVDELDPAVDMQELARRKRWEGPVKPGDGKTVADSPAKSL